MDKETANELFGGLLINSPKKKKTKEGEGVRSTNILSVVIVEKSEVFRVICQEGVGRKRVCELVKKIEK